MKLDDWTETMGVMMSQVFIPAQKLVQVSHWAYQQYLLWKASFYGQPPHTSTQSECMFLLGWGHLHLVIGTCIVFAYLSSSFDVPTE